MIKDRIILGILAGAGAMVAKNVAYHVLAYGIERAGQGNDGEMIEPYRTVASEVWVDNPRWLNTTSGAAVGLIHDLWLSIAGTLGLVGTMTATGKDHLPVKGVLYGVGFGALVTAILSLSGRKRLRDASPVGTLAYVAAHAVYGLTAATIVKGLGDPGLFSHRLSGPAARRRASFRPNRRTRPNEYGRAGSPTGDGNPGGWAQD